jgi:hypothetical protein
VHNRRCLIANHTQVANHTQGVGIAPDVLDSLPLLSSPFIDRLDGVCASTLAILGAVDVCESESEPHGPDMNNTKEGAASPRLTIRLPAQGLRAVIEACALSLDMPLHKASN